MIFSSLFSFFVGGGYFCLKEGYAVIDLEILNPSKVEDICLSKFLSLVLQVLQLLACLTSLSLSFKTLLI